MDDLRFLDVIQAIFDCVRDGLASTTNQAPARAYVTMGEPAWDDCCVGQLAVWWTRIYPSARFPDADTRPIVCAGAQTAVEVAIEVMRCAPSSDVNGNPPTVAAMQEAARVANVDARAVWLAVQCCLASHRGEWSAIVSSQVPMGADGGCVGSRMLVTIGIEDGCGCG